MHFVTCGTIYFFFIIFISISKCKIRSLKFKCECKDGIVRLIEKLQYHNKPQEQKHKNNINKITLKVYGNKTIWEILNLYHF